MARWKFTVPQSFKGQAGIIHGFKINRIDFDIEDRGVTVGLQRGWFQDDQLGEEKDFNAVDGEVVLLTPVEYNAKADATPNARMRQMVQSCYEAVAAKKGLLWDGSFLGKSRST